jgi:hypothetical protein
MMEFRNRVVRVPLASRESEGSREFASRHRCEGREEIPHVATRTDRSDNMVG